MLLKNKTDPRILRTRKHVFSLLLCVPLMATALVPVTAQASFIQKPTLSMGKIPTVTSQKILVSSEKDMRKKVKEIETKHKNPLHLVKCLEIRGINKAYCVALEFYQKNSDKQKNETERIVSQVLLRTNISLSIVHGMVKNIKNIKKLSLIEIQIKSTSKAKK